MSSSQAPTQTPEQLNNPMLMGHSTQEIDDGTAVGYLLDGDKPTERVLYLNPSALTVQGTSIAGEVPKELGTNAQVEPASLRFIDPDRGDITTATGRENALAREEMQLGIKPGFIGGWVKVEFSGLLKPGPKKIAKALGSIGTIDEIEKPVVRVVHKGPLHIKGRSMEVEAAEHHQKAQTRKDRLSHKIGHLVHHSA